MAIRRAWSELKSWRCASCRALRASALGSPVSSCNWASSSRLPVVAAIFERCSACWRAVIICPSALLQAIETRRSSSPRDSSAKKSAPDSRSFRHSLGCPALKVAMAARHKASGVPIRSTNSTRRAATALQFLRCAANSQYSSSASADFVEARRALNAASYGSQSPDFRDSKR